MLKAFKYRIQPTESQQVLLAKHFGCVRMIYNRYLDVRKRNWEEEKRNVGFAATCKFLTELKRTEEFSYLNEVNSQALQSSLKNLDCAYQRFFKMKKGYPSFKSKHDKQSFQCPQFIVVENNQLYLPKFKDGIEINLHRSLPKGKIKTCTISKTKTGKYFVSILVEDGTEVPPKPEINPDTTIGIDLGLTDFITTSNGEKIKSPKFFRKKQIALKRAQKKLSRKVKGSKNRDKQRARLAKIHEKIANQRKDFHHKLSTKIIRENQTICLESLKVDNMLQNNKLAKSISDAGWSSFVNMLEYKAEWYGKNILRIGTYVPSSKMCTCGVKNENLSLKDREWTCTSCHVTHDRDILAANNIKKFALNAGCLVQSIGQSASQTAFVP